MPAIFILPSAHHDDHATRCNVNAISGAGICCPAAVSFPCIPALVLTMLMPLLQNTTAWMQCAEMILVVGYTAVAASILSDSFVGLCRRASGLTMVDAGTATGTQAAQVYMPRGLHPTWGSPCPLNPLVTSRFT